MHARSASVSSAGNFELPTRSIADQGGEIYAGVWPEAASMRSISEFPRITARIECPVVAIQGEYTPVEAVAAPLTATLWEFQIIVLDKCGHDPWRERWAVDTFYDILERQLIS